MRKALTANDVQAPLYTLKARLFLKSMFVVGYDTAIRLVDPKYYGGHTGMLLQFSELAHNGCSFLVRAQPHLALAKGLPPASKILCLRESA